MLHVFGDSHSQILGGSIVLNSVDRSEKFRNIKTHWLEEALAFNLMAGDGAVGKHGQTILDILDRQERPACVLLVFGEIDLRVHVLRRAIAAGAEHPSANFLPIVARIGQFARLVHARHGCPVVVLAPVPGAPDFKGYNPFMPNTGSERERNHVCYLFGRALSAEAAVTGGFHVIDLFDQLTLPGLQTNQRYYADEIHLNYEGLALFADAFRRLSAAEGLGLPDYWSPSEVRAADQFRVSNIAARCRIIAMSSAYNTINGLQAHGARGYCFHTREDDVPSVMFDIGYAALTAGLRLHNRARFETRCRELKVEVSLSGGDFIEVHREVEPFGLDGQPLEIDLRPYCGQVRFVRLSLGAKSFFHLREVEVLEYKLLDF